MIIHRSWSSVPECAVLLIPLVVIAVAVWGIVRSGWSFTASVFWRVACFILPILPVLIGVATYTFCKWIRYDNGSSEGFHPDSFAFGCFLVLTPGYIILALIFSILAKGIRLVASAINCGLGILWLYAIMHIRM